MHAEKLVAPVNCDNILPVKTSSASYMSDLNSTSPTVNELYSNSKPSYLTMNDSSAGCCQPSIYSYGQTSFNNAGNNNINNYDQAAINRRKNATRETTNTLKAWLYEHRKNPYPTKGEKIMLAIITKMTLTQVSTWFANARRRLKKENKMTWEPRNKCNSGSGDESSDSETMINENQESTNINDESYNATKKLKKSNIKNENDDDLISGVSSDEQTVYRRSKIKSVDDSDSNTSSNLVQRNSPLFNNKANFSNFGKTDLNYSSNENGFSNLGSSENRERFFNYSSVGRNHEQNQVQYNSNRITHHPQYLSYSSISSVVPTTNLTYVQSQQHMNENPLYNLNTIHSHQYLNSKHQSENFQATNPPSSNLPLHQSQITQDLNIIHTPQHHSVYHHHHVPTNLNHHNTSYSLLQSSYQADCMLAQQTHQIHQPTASVNIQQLNQNSIYYPPIPQTQNTLTQQLSPHQVQSSSRINNCESSNFINPLTSAKVHSNKCDENNNSDNNLETSSSQENGLANSTLENTRKIWSLAQTATDSLSISNSIANPAIGTSQENISPLVSSNSSSVADNLSASTYISSTIDHSTQQTNDQLTKNSSSLNISSTPSLQLPVYMNNQLINNNSSVIDNNSMVNSNNQPVQNYNNTLHQNYSSLDCSHNSNTFLGKVFFDYISTGTTGPLENDRNWTRIGLL